MRARARRQRRARLEVELAYIGDPADTVYSRVSQGLEEADLQGRFLVQRYRLTS